MADIRERLNKNDTVTLTCVIPIPKNYPYPHQRKNIIATRKVRAGQADEIAIARHELELESMKLKKALRDQTWRADGRDKSIEAGTLAAFIDMYILDVEPSRTQQNRLRLWQNELFAHKKIEMIERADLINWHKKKQSAGRAANTIRNDLNALSAVYEFLINDLELHDLRNRAAQLRKSRVNKIDQDNERDRTASPEEQELILQTINTPGLDGKFLKYRDETRAAVIIALETGMRQSEILRMRADEIEIKDSGFGIASLPITKTKRKRHVILSPRAVQAIQKLKREEGPLFTFTQDNLQAMMKTIWRRSRIKDLHFHDFRHTALTNLAAAGLSLKDLMMQSGHTSVQTLMRYLNPTVDDRLEAMRAREEMYLAKLEAAVFEEGGSRDFPSDRPGDREIEMDMPGEGDKLESSEEFQRRMRAYEKVFGPHPFERHQE